MKKAFLVFLPVVCYLLSLSSVVFSYTVVRKDGKTFRGELIRQSPEIVVLKDKDGVQLHFRAEQIDWTKTTEALREEEKKRVDEKTETKNIVTVFRGEKRKFEGEAITVDIVDADLRDFFRFLAEVGKMNLILDPSVKGTVTVRMVEVPWDQVLDVVCRNFGLGYTIDGNVISAGKKKHVK